MIARYRLLGYIAASEVCVAALAVPLLPVAPSLKSLLSILSLVALQMVPRRLLIRVRV